MTKSDECELLNDVYSQLLKADEIAHSGIENMEPAFLAEGAFTLLMINLNDALQTLSEGFDSRIKFQDYVPDGDITDLVNKFRCSLCHVRSKERNVLKGSSRVFFGRIGPGDGKTPAIVFETDEGIEEIINPFSDDDGLMYGHRIIYLNNHIKRSISEAMEATKQQAELKAYRLR